MLTEKSYCDGEHGTSYTYVAVYMYQAIILLLHTDAH